MGSVAAPDGPPVVVTPEGERVRGSNNKETMVVSTTEVPPATTSMATGTSSRPDTTACSLGKATTRTDAPSTF